MSATENGAPQECTCRSCMSRLDRLSAEMRALTERLRVGAGVGPALAVEMAGWAS